MASAGARDWVDYCFKIIIIGDYRVGKTSLLCRYTGSALPNADKSINVDVRVKTLHKGDKRVKLQIWDIAGQERFRTAGASYYRGALGVLLVYDVTNRESFQNIGYWHEEMRRSCEPNAKGILVGNRCHLSHLREVGPEDGRQLAEHLQLPYYETSSIKNINVNECFDELVDSILEEMERGKQIRELTPLVLQDSGLEARSTETPSEGCSCMLL